MAVLVVVGSQASVASREEAFVPEITVRTSIQHVSVTELVRTDECLLQSSQEGRGGHHPTMAWFASHPYFVSP